MGTGHVYTSLEAFLDSTGSPTSPKKWVRITPDPLYATRIYLSLRAARLHHNPVSGLATNLCHPIAWLLPRQVPRSPTHNQQVDNVWFWVVSIHDSPVGAYTRVREYQPVVHRLRLSASP